MSKIWRRSLHYRAAIHLANFEKWGQYIRHDLGITLTNIPQIAVEFRSYSPESFYGNE